MFDSMGSILEALSPEQQIACSTQNNILLTACPGSGKTRTLTHRLAYQVLRDPASKKIKIAITYTNRAAEEITNRLEGMNIDQSSIWAGTIHQFCMHFIIRPYAMYSKRLCKGYRIIDDYSKKAYGREIAERLGMHLNYYDDPFQYENVRTEYKRVLKEKKEIDFDAILLISEELLASCAFIGSNIASVISSILVDEFQDTNELQYTILSYIYKANKSITLMFVGDVNQAIYTSLGGVAKEKKELEALYGTSDIQSYDVLSSVNCCRHIDADGIICLSVAIQKVFALLNICVSKESSLSELKASFLMKSAQE